jgi:hypothetical protein
VGKKRRIEIRIQTRQVLIVQHAANIKRQWCPQCGGQVDMIRMENSSALNAESLRASGIEVDADKLHVTEMPDGSLLVCLNSFME